MCYRSNTLPPCQKSQWGSMRFPRTVAHWRGGNSKCATMRKLRPLGKYDITGERFVKLTAIRFVGMCKGRRLWLCKCDCGNTTEVLYASLKYGNTKSCGCYRSVWTINRFTSHGLTRTPEYRAWISIKSRCYNPKTSHYDCYGGRGIRICSRWKTSFKQFFSDMGKRPTPNHSIHRKNNDGNYCKSNCVWATQKIQSRAKTNTRYLNYNGKPTCLADVADSIGIRRQTLQSRIVILGWSDARAISEPVRTFIVRKNAAKI